MLDHITAYCLPKASGLHVHHDAVTSANPSAHVKVLAAGTEAVWS